jgi:hypothetical protein
MTDRRGLAGISVFLAFLLGAVSVMADTATGSSSFTYSEGWDVVSAPPPPGPYRAVNLDPRIPGQDSIPLMPVEEPPPGIPAEALDNPPAAGAPALSKVPDEPAASLDAGQAAPAQQASGRYNRRMPAPPAYNYQAPSRYPAQSGYSGYRNTPSMGYYGTPVRRPPQQVPPPPVYDAMINKRQPYSGQGIPGMP